MHIQYIHICTYVLCTCVRPVYCVICLCVWVCIWCMFIFEYMRRPDTSDRSAVFVAATFVGRFALFRCFVFRYFFSTSSFLFFLIHYFLLFSLTYSYLLFLILSLFSLLDPKPMADLYFPSCVRSAYSSSSEFALPLSAAILHVAPSDFTFLQASAYASL